MRHVLEHDLFHLDGAGGPDGKVKTGDTSFQVEVERILSSLS